MKKILNNKIVVIIGLIAVGFGAYALSKKFGKKDTVLIDEKPSPNVPIDELKRIANEARADRPVFEDVPMRSTRNPMRSTMY